MRYFRLRQDPDFHNAPLIPNLIKQIDRRYITPDAAWKIGDVSFFHLVGQDSPDFIDILDKQIFLVSELLKEAIALYVPQLAWKIVILASKAQKTQQAYYLPVFAPWECLAPESIMTPDKSSVKQLVLQKKLIPKQAVFRVQHNYETIIVVRLDAVESILRRKMRGVKLLQIELA